MGQKVCLIAPEFYHYHDSIISCLQKKSFEVLYYPEMPSNFSVRLIKNISEKWYASILDKYFNGILKDLENHEINIFFFIRAEVVPVSFIDQLKARFQSAKFVMYQWDSCFNNNYMRLIPHFDIISTFDPKDAKDLSIQYLPLFYVASPNNAEVFKRDIDFLFVGSMNEKRIVQFREFHNTIPDGVKSYIVLYVSVPSYIKYLLKTGDFRSFKEVSFKKVSFDQLENLMIRSKNIIDYPSSSQTGISVRSFEAISKGARLITSNSTICDVFPELNGSVVIVDPQDFNFQSSYLKDLKDEKSISIVEKYNIDLWIDMVLEL